MISMPELLVILVIVLVLFGPKKLPELARSVGESVNAYREGMAGKRKPKKLQGLVFSGANKRGDSEVNI